MILGDIVLRLHVCFSFKSGEEKKKIPEIYAKPQIGNVTQTLLKLKSCYKWLYIC